MVRNRQNIGRNTRRNARRATIRAAERVEQRNTRVTAVRQSTTRTRMQLNQNNDRQSHVLANMKRAAFSYDNTIDYTLHESLLIGTMSVVCKHCNALKFKHEVNGLCCSNGKVKLPA